MDMQPENQTASMPTLCRAGCGFYGSSATENLCSKCFKDALKRKQDPNRQVGATLFAGISSSLTTAESAVDQTTEVTPDEVPLKAPNVEPLEPSAAAPALPAPSSDCTQTATSSIEAPKSNVDDENSEHAALSPGGSVDTKSNDSTAATATPSPTTNKPRNRCETCNKKVGFTGFECRCGGIFCGTHRYSDLHDCQFDYKSLGAEEIKKNNPVVSKEKIKKI